MATFNYNGVGLRNVGSYSVSGAPWITGSVAMHSQAHAKTAAASSSAGMYRVNGEGTNAKPAESRVNFPNVTKSFTVITSGSQGSAPIVRVHFASMFTEDTSGSPKHNDIINHHHFIQLDGIEESLTMNVKCSTIYLSTPNDESGFQMYAELTNIPTGSMYTLTGSGITE